MAFPVRGRVAAIPDRVLDARLIACLLQPMGCARLNDLCVHDGTMGQMLPSTDSAISDVSPAAVIVRSPDGP
jgi:hypothetical protein